MASAGGDGETGGDTAVEEGTTAGTTEEEGGPTSDKKAGFSLSMETVTSTPRRRIKNVLGPGRRTRKGPSNGGVRGRRTASTRSSTWEAEAKLGSIREGCDPCGRTGIGREDFMQENKCREKSDAEGDGVEGSTRSPGSRK